MAKKPSESLTVAAVFPEPVVLDVAKGIIPEKPAETAAACLCREIEESRALFSAGNAVSQSQLMGLLNRASAWVKEPDYR